MSRPKAIIFDCWSTLFYAEQRPLVLRLVASKLLHRRLSYALTKRLERSMMLAPEADPSAVARKLLHELHLPPLPGLVAQVKRALHDTNRQPYPETLETLRLLKKDYALGLITNTSEVSFAPLRQEFKLDRYFDEIVTSYEAGVLKPDPQIFRLALRQLNVVPEAAVMVGDNPRDDVAAAQAIGMRAVLVDRHRRHLNAPHRVTSLRELPARAAEPADRAGIITPCLINPRLPYPTSPLRKSSKSTPTCW
jgi:2-haloalkanoic acid dehalogenase type II